MKEFDNETSSGHAAVHQRVMGILPWYVNNTLSTPERTTVTRHLSTCLVCRRDVMALETLQQAVAARRHEPRCEAALGRLHERIDATPQRLSGIPWAAAAVLVLVIGLAGLVGVNTGLFGSDGRAYNTLGARSVSMMEGATVTARIVFEQDITERQLRELLLKSHAELIDGPTPRGAYTIALPEIAPDDDLQAAVANLRASRRVIFVEPIVSINRVR